MGSSIPGYFFALKCLFVMLTGHFLCGLNPHFFGLFQPQLKLNLICFLKITPELRLKLYFSEMIRLNIQ
ncbi:hypothetical protein CDG60_06270 [Acinetobacter chinensis]|uniref:Uncharacterized protein n=1 Tax=Acinetobacter chinensis TaxID=2004650 RepID=A0A3B7M0H2_9GAMM|nr:hypothetical protein CDG60_06270 [Acinetobacter chinensis]